MQPEEPHRLCETCGVQILEMFSFRKTLIQTQAILENMLSATVSPHTFQSNESEEFEFSNVQEHKFPTFDEDIEEEPIDIQSIEVKHEEVTEGIVEELESNVSYEIIEEGMDYVHDEEKYIVIAMKDDQPVLPELKQKVDEKNDTVVVVDKLGREQKCPFCGSQHTTHASLLRHMRAKHPEERTIPCEYCDLKMFTETDRSYHYRVCEKLREAKSVAEYNCPQCGILVVGANKLRMHINSSHRVRTPNASPFICDLCGKLLKNKHCLQVHMKIQHISVKNFKCEHCQESYKSISGLKYHIAQNHSESSGVFKCSLCDFETKQEFLLRRHLRRHNPDKSYVCNQCGRSFGSLDSLKSHMYSHASDRPFNCDACDKTFKSKAKLRSHVRSHEGRKYECSVCLSLYLSNQALRNHLQKQHPEYDLPPPGTVLCETKAQLPKRIIRLELR